MQYKLLGRSGLRVPELALGTMTFAEAGGNFIDTANIYTQGTSEECVGEFVRADRRGHARNRRPRAGG